MRPQPSRLVFHRRLGAPFAMACSLLASGCEQTLLEPADAPVTAPAATDTFCVPLVAGDSLRREFTDVTRSTDTMAQLPLTGVPVLREVTASGMNVCRIQKTDDYLGAFDSTGRILLTPNVEMNVIVHEYFHAHQHQQGVNVFLDRPVLTARDAVFANLLIEATTVAYELAFQKEADLQSVPYAGGRQTASNSRSTRHLFNVAFSEKMQTYGGVDTPDSRRAALAYAGQKVVLYLMARGDEMWGDAYARQAAVISTGLPFAHDGCSATYRAARAGLYQGIGHVSENLNLLPSVYTGRDADHFIARDFDRFMLLKDTYAAANRCSKSPSPGV